MTSTAVPAHHSGRVNKGIWVGVPRKGDPRIPFAMLMTLYAVTGAIFFSFNRSPLQMLVIVGSGALLDMFLHYVLRERKLLVPLSAYISCISLALILNYSHSLWLTLFPVYITIAFKYVLTLRGRHAYNPSLLGVVASLVFAGSLISAAPAYQWGAWWYTSSFMVAAAVMLFVTKVNRHWLAFSFIIFYALQTALRAYVLRYHVPWDVMFLGTMTTPPFFLFTFFMITDPATSPPSRKGQVGIAAAITLVDLYFHTLWSVYTFFYAAFTVATARYLWGQFKVARELGIRGRIQGVAASAWPKAVAVVLALGLVGGTAWATVIHPSVHVRDAGFTFTEVAPEDSGLGIGLDGATLKLVDPRVEHIAKWLISVGAGAYADDADGDGKTDLFMTSPLGVNADRAVFYRNITQDGKGLKFERTKVPALSSTVGNPGKVGLPSGGLFVDYDNDGDRDLLVLMAFGNVKLLRNDSSAPGEIKYTDVSEKSGVEEYFIGASANALDYDADGDLDILLGEILKPNLPGYDTTTPLNIFDLPKPENDGDRRAMNFMHSSWDNATNGGENVMYRNEGDGTFTRIKASKLGMPETHFTISIGTGDLNKDGFTDLYLASDFGRDDVYINEGGKGFRRVAGWFHGSLGKDTYKGMNSSIADLDRNGWQDVYVSNVHHALQAEGSLLWMNEGTKDGTSEHEPPASAKQYPAPKMRDQATNRGALNEDRFGWGGDTGDFDNDGWLDLTQTNGMVGDSLDEMADGKRGDGCPDYWYVNHKLMQSGPEIHRYADKWGDLRGRCIFADEKQRLYLNREGVGKKVFVDVAEQVGLTHTGEGRGTAIADFNNDGWLDMVVAFQHDQPVALQSEASKLGKSRSWLSMRLRSTKSTCNRDAVGSQVELLRRSDRPQLQEVQLVNGFSAQRDPRMHFGLGTTSAKTITVAVTWCGRGEPERFRVPVNSDQTLVQGAGK